MRNRERVFTFLEKRVFEPKEEKEKEIEKHHFLLIEKLKEANFEVLKSPEREIIEKNEVILKRKKGSNFFVFTKREKGKITVLFSNPTSDFSPREGVILKFSYKKGNFEKWQEKVLKKIKEISAKKPENLYFCNLHSHWGIIDNKIVDDGISKAKDIIRELMLYHYDVDGSTFHWFINKAHFEKRKKFSLEKIDFKEFFNFEKFQRAIEITNSVGMIKIPAVELEIPIGYKFKNKEKRATFKGPHFLLWFADLDVLKDCLLEVNKIGEKITLSSHKPLPLFSEKEIDMFDILEIFNKYRKEKKLAVGLAHPAIHSKTKGSFGLLNLVTEGKMEPYQFYEIIEKYVDSIEEFNFHNLPYLGRLSFKKIEGKLKEEKNKKFLTLFGLDSPENIDEKLKIKINQEGFGKSLYPNSLTLLLAKNLKGKKNIHSATDAHKFSFNVYFKFPKISGTARTEILLDQNLTQEKLTSQKIISELLIPGNKRISPRTFFTLWQLPFRKEIPKIIRERDTHPLLTGGEIIFKSKIKNLKKKRF